MIRKATLEDLEDLVKLYRGSIKKMISKKISQWDYEYPNREVLKKDISYFPEIVPVLYISIEYDGI